MKKLLNILGTLGLVSTSATAIVAFAKLPRTNIPEVLSAIITKDQLNQLITDAKTLATQEQSKPINAYKLLHQAIGQAKGASDIYINETENFNVLNEAYQKLTAAINAFKQTDDEKANIESLKNRITSANNALQTNTNKLETEKQKLKKVIGEAENLVSKVTLRKDQNLVDQALLNLQTGIVNFLNSTNDLANYADLTKAMDEAKKALKDYPKKHPGVIQSLTKAIANAQKVIEQKYTTADQNIVDQEVEILKKEIQIFFGASKAEANVDALNQAIVEAKKIAQDFKNNQAWLKLQQAIKHAQGVVDGKPSVDRQNIVDQEVTNLQQAAKDFNNISNQNADLTWLNSNIKMAETINIKNKKQSDWNIFQTEILKAKDYVKNPPLIDKQDQVDEMTENLWQATYKFLNATDRKDIRSTIFWKTSIGSLKDNKHETIKKRLEETYTLKEGKDYTIGEVKDYNGKFGVELTGKNDYLQKTVVTFVLDIQNIENDMDILATSKQDQFWTAHELQLAIEKENLDKKNTLKVTEVAHDPNLKVKRFKIRADDQYEYSKYQGEIIVSQVLNRENQDKTIYIDQDGTIKSNDNSAPEGVKEVINIGWSSNKKVHEMPRSIQKVPPYISPKIESLYHLFGWAESFNQPLNNWDVSKVTNMERTFNGAESFNQDISKWDT
ncbi:BspA family leucine-rich repeat surface protein, partial [Williamsoniiplasma luminosum]